MDKYPIKVGCQDYMMAGVSKHRYTGSDAHPFEDKCPFFNDLVLEEHLLVCIYFCITLLST